MSGLKYLDKPEAHLFSQVGSSKVQILCDSTEVQFTGLFQVLYLSYFFFFEVLFTINS